MLDALPSRTFRVEGISMRKLILAAACALLSACASYTTPAAGVSIASISERDSNIADAFKREAAAAFPARLAVARVAASGYSSLTNRGYGTGRFSVLTVRDVETPASLDKLNAMPQVAAVATLSRILLPDHLESIRDLRQSAAELKADMLLVYSIDTGFRTETNQIGPLQTVALGMLSTHKSFATSTCSFAIIDVRTGYVYGTGETTATEDQRSNLWGSADAIDKARQHAESKAFDDAVGEVQKLWVSVVKEHGR
jgi:hypothetical protein